MLGHMAVTLEKAPWDAGRRQRPAPRPPTPTSRLLLLLSQPLFAVPESRVGSAPADCSPASWETHPLVWSNVLAADHHPSECQEAVAQVADLERAQEMGVPESLTPVLLPGSAGRGLGFQPVSWEASLRSPGPHSQGSPFRKGRNPSRAHAAPALSGAPVERAPLGRGCPL